MSAKEKAGTRKRLPNDFVNRCIRRLNPPCVSGSPGPFVQARAPAA
jgi:hypothetical protein